MHTEYAYDVCVTTWQLIGTEITMRSNRLAGHTLPNEGRIQAEGLWVEHGPARRSCGVESEPLKSDNARRRWHFAHKAEIRVAQEGVA